MADFHFIRPFALLALIPALLIAYSLLKRKLSRSVWTAVCDEELLPFLLIDKAATQHRLYFGLGLLASVLAIFALAGPTWERLPVPVFRNTSALVIALNLAQSMDAQDIKPSRLTRARYKIADLLQQRKDGQTALIVYAGEAFTVTPLTDDTATIANQLEVLTTDLMPSPGRNARLAFIKAISLFKQAGLQKGQLVLITDGIDETPSDLITLAEHENITVSVLGVGTPEGAPVALPGGGFLKDDNGAIVLPKLDDAKLSQLALLGHGIYQRLGADDNDIQALQALLAAPVTADNGQTDASDVKLDQWQELGPWLLLFVLPLAALLFRKGLLISLVFVLLPQPNTAYAWGWQDLWQTQEQQAQQAFTEQNYAQAAKQFTRPDWKAAAKYKAGERYSEPDYQDALKKLTTSDGFYNLGNALAGTGELEKAIDAYQRALKINPDNADAKYNKELVEKALEKQQQDQQKQQQEQQQKQNQKQQQDQQQDSSEQQANENDGKPEQKPEHGEQQPPSEQSEQNQQPSEQAQQQQQQKQASEQQQAASQQKPAEPKKDNDKQEPVAGESSVKPNDKQQAINEQWLKRIPDDPGGLLRRKFQYQYGQRNAEQIDKPW